MRQSGLRQIETDADQTDRIPIMVDRGELVAQADGQAAIEAEPGIAVGFLTGAQLHLQAVELAAHVEDGLQRPSRRDPDRTDAHGDLTSSSGCRASHAPPT